MKRLLSLFIMFSLLMTLSSCTRNESIGNSSSDQTTDEKGVVETEESTDVDESYLPDEFRIQQICELATVECYYNNVAVATKEPGSGLSHWMEEDTEFWVEYSATATLGVDASRITIDRRGNDLYIYMPPAMILGDIVIDPESVDDPIYRPDEALRNDVEITSSDVNEAMDTANEDIRELILADPYLLESAYLQAQSVIQQYIDQLSYISGITYEVHFESLTE